MEIRPAFLLIVFLMLMHPAVARTDEGMRVVPAQEILDKIERGKPVEYDHVIVEGDLDLRKMELPEIHVKNNLSYIDYCGLSEKVSFVSSSIRIDYSNINGNISFGDAIFGKPVYLRGSYFNSTADFGGSTFDDIVRFISSTFNGTADFQGSTFNRTADFGGSAFNRIAYFRGSALNGDVNFGGSTFNRIADFDSSAFNGDADFRGSTFNRTANFEDSVFNHNAYFGDSIFNGMRFINSTFNSDADFRGSTFNRTVNFEDSVFNHNACFRDSTFNGIADFRGSAFNISDFSSAEFNKQVHFDDANFINSTSFNSSRFKEDALFEGVLLDGPLYLTRAKYDRLYIRWKNIKDLGYDDAAYLALLENFKKLGYVEDYDACYYEYRRLHRDQPWSGKYHALSPGLEGALKRIDLGLQYFYGYGKKPHLPLLWSLGTILLFGLIWRRAGVDGGKGRGGIFERYSQRGAQIQKKSPSEQLRALFGAMLFSATLFLSGTRLFVDPPAMPALEGWFAAHARGFFIAERVLGAFFSILFFLAISGTVVR